MRIIKLVGFLKYYMFLKLYIYILFKVKFEMLINIWFINKLKEEEIFLYCIKYVEFVEIIDFFRWMIVFILIYFFD